MVIPDWQRKVQQELRSNPLTYDYADRSLSLVGSTAVNGSGNDIDIVLEHNDLDDAAVTLEAAGWAVIASEVYRGVQSDGWFSARKGELNLLVSITEVRELWLAANEVCKVFVAIVDRPSTRDERVAFHRAVFND